MVKSGSCILPRKTKFSVHQPSISDSSMRVELEVDASGSYSPVSSKNSFLHPIHSFTHSLNIYLPIFQVLCEEWKHAAIKTPVLVNLMPYGWCGRGQISKQIILYTVVNII